jgi:hypothetical protein
MRRRLSGVGVSLLTSLLLVACVPGGTGLSARQSLTESRKLDPSGTFRLENTNGSVTVETWAEARVRIEAEKAAPSQSALDRIEIVIDGEGDRVAVRTRFPRSGGFFLGPSGRVNYTITLPRAARVEVETVNGPVHLDGVAGAVRAKAVNGPVEVVGAAGEVRASTVNGPVEAELIGISPDGRTRLSAVNGPVTLTLPEATGEVEASTVNGRVACDFPLQAARTQTRRHLEGRLGPGDARFELATVNGPASIRQGRGTRLPAESPATGR